MLLTLPVVLDYLATGLVPRQPSLIVSVGLVVVALLSLVCGLILDTVAAATRPGSWTPRRLAYRGAVPGPQAMPGSDRAAALKLLTVSNFFDTHRGGLEIVAGRLARELADRGFAVTWLASDATFPLTGCAAQGVTTESFSIWNVAERRLGVPWPLLGPSAIGRIWRETRAADAVLLHDSLYLTSIVTYMAAKAHRTPLLIVQHIGAVPYRNPILRGLMALGNRLVARPILGGAEQVVFISQFVRDYFGRLNFRRPPQLVFNGVDTGVFRPGTADERAAARARFGFGEGERVALFVGRFVEKKGVARLGRAAAQRPDITFAFAGWGLIDPDAWRLPNVRVFSDLSGGGLAQLYQASDVFVLPSHGEGFPLVVQEALACGLPVVCGREAPAPTSMRRRVPGRDRCNGYG